MALTKGVNSYVDLTEADAYFVNRLDVAAWTDATSDQKSQALVTATSLLDELRWVGIAVSESQSLAFPRSGVYFDPKQGTDVVLNELTVPERINRATFELAYHLLNNDGLLDSTGSVESINVGSISLSKVRNPSTIPNVVKTIYRPLLESGTTNSWWRAN